METDKVFANPDFRITSGYRIQVDGTLDEYWSSWFDGIELTIERSDDRQPVTTLHCLAMDQARLRGVLNKIWDLNLSLLSVTPAKVVQRDQT